MHEVGNDRVFFFLKIITSHTEPFILGCKSLYAQGALIQMALLDPCGVPACFFFFHFFFFFPNKILTFRGSRNY